MESAFFDEAQTAFQEGRYEDVIVALGELHRDGQVSVASVRLCRDAYMKMGELHKALGELNRLRAIAPSPAFDRSARSLLGRIIESDPNWLPRINRPAPTAPAAKDNLILHILKESLPYSETGFTMRSRMTLAAQKLAGFTPEVITSLGFPRTKGVESFQLVESIDGVTHYRLDDSAVSDPSKLPFDVNTERAANMAAGIADGLGARLVQAGTGFRGFDTALQGIALADRYDIPFVYEVRGFQEQTWTGNIERSERGEYFRRRYGQENRCMHRADLVITIAEAMAEEIVARGISEDKVSVVPNAIDVNRFTPRGKRDDLVERYGLSGRFVVGYISNLGAREGIDDLIRAVAILRSRKHELACVIAGDGPQRSMLEDLVSELHLDDYVILTGHVPNEQIEDHYALIDLFVVPRIDDRAARLVTPLKPLEAMSMGLPVVASSLPALAELVAPGKRGLTFPPSDPAAMADVIDSLIGDSVARQTYAKAGQDWVRNDRTLQSNAERYGKLLSPLLG
jgi:glycosyltransferase involved in cell wall biosynthesis